MIFLRRTAVRLYLSAKRPLQPALKNDREIPPPSSARNARKPVKYFHHFPPKPQPLWDRQQCDIY